VEATTVAATTVRDHHTAAAIAARDLHTVETTMG